jgi:hypothetical protein
MFGEQMILFVNIRQAEPSSRTLSRTQLRWIPGGEEVEREVRDGSGRGTEEGRNRVGKRFGTRFGKRLRERFGTRFGKEVWEEGRDRVREKVGRNSDSGHTCECGRI